MHSPPPSQLYPVLIPVVISGGLGSRLWPVSREGQPKPFMKILDEQTLLEKTYRRAAMLSHVPKINGKPFVITVTNHDHYFISKDELEKAQLSGVFLLEPEGRNTAPAITMAAHYIKKYYGDNVSMLVLPADHLIQNNFQFKLTIEDALRLNYETQPYLVAFGVNPEKPDIGFGYIKKGESLTMGYKASHFYEKPDLKTAEEYLASNDFYWNSGIYLFKVDHFLDEMAENSPEVLDKTLISWKSCLTKSLQDKTKIEIPKSTFKDCPNISIDYALMEKSKHIAVIPISFDWNDIGSWLSFSELFQGNHENNKLIGDGLFIKSKNTFIQSHNRYIAAVGVKNLIIIDTSDALLVIDKKHTQDVKLVTSKLKLNHLEILHSHQTVNRPWGKFTTLQSGLLFKIKCIEVDPLKSLSLQSHKHRSEHWIVIEGEAEITNQDKIYRIKTNESTFIAEGSKHRLTNPSDNSKLLIIEVQSGSYLGEDDIQRYEDHFDRI
jgi:mannose-1-phosphate guanylyltransferase/mannose-6-phosphate isomerase